MERRSIQVTEGKPGQRYPNSGQAGFTLIELLMAMAIIAVLAGVAAFSVGRARENAHKNACLTERRAFETAQNVATFEEQDIRSWISSTTGKYFQVSGFQSFELASTNPLDIDCQ